MQSRIFNKLSREQELINKIIYKTGFLNYEQIKAILNNMPEKGLSVVLNVLKVKEYIDKNEDMYYPHGYTNKITRENINCIWTVINEITNREDYQTFEKAEYPSQYSFIMGSRKIYEVVSINEDNLMSLMQLQNRYFAQYGREPVSTFQYILSIENEELLEKISDYNLEMPHKIVLITYENISERPVFQTFE